MSNPNNCETCKFKQMSRSESDSWCYMFRDEPNEPCSCHSGRARTSTPALMQGIAKILGDFVKKN